MSERLLCALIFAALSVQPSLARDGIFGSDYAEVGRCGPFARVAVRTPPWACVGIVAGHQQGLIRPRNLIEVGPHLFIISDMFGWGDEGHRGRILRLSVSPDGNATVTPLITGLTLPHGIARGPDNLVYVSEPDRISRFDPAAEKPVKEEVFVGFPFNPYADLHPLRNMIFDATGALIVDVGAPTDRCEASYGDFKTIQHPCALTDTDPHPRGALWRLVFDKPGGHIVSVEVLARGLRNSMALAVHPRSGVLLEADNSLDVFSRDPRTDPPDELNIIEAGRHYGWPYCSGKAIVTPEYADDHIDCAKFQAPLVLLPPHSAPLGMAYYSGNLFPELTGKLIVGFHSLNPRPGNGHRIGVYDVAETGAPLPKPPLWLADDWSEKPGLRPQGTPVGLTVASDGSIWFVEDANQTVMVMLRP
jgi:glucose/arabinose dehydrogenase